MSEAQYNGEVASAFLNAWNSERTQRGLTPVTIENGSKAQSIATARIPQVLSQQTAGQGIYLDHYYGGAMASRVLSKQLGFNGIGTSETLSGAGENSQTVMTNKTPSSVGAKLLHEMIYNDAESANVHRDTLLETNGTHAGIAVGQVYGSVIVVTEQSAK